MKTLPTLIAASLGFFIIPATAQETKAETPAKVSPWSKDDGDWITISGKVTKAGVNAFTLDYGKGAITVELDDYDKKLEGFNIVKDDKVIVVGRVDADKGQKRSIEASSVYVKNIKKSFFASADDEEEVIAKLRKDTAEGNLLSLTGKVTLTAENFITIDTGYQLVDVSTQALNEKATDDKGRIQVDKGDTVTVHGSVTDGFFDSNKLVAVRVIEK